MADVHACALCRLRFSDAESPAEVHGECLEELRELLEKSHELLAEEADALTADYVAVRQRIREMLTELEADDGRD